MLLEVKCIQCGKKFSKEFDADKIERVKKGELVQYVFPELTPDDRELFFISKVCPTCWDNLFGVLEPKGYEEEPSEEYIEERYELLEEAKNGK